MSRKGLHSRCRFQTVLFLSLFLTCLAILPTWGRASDVVVLVDGSGGMKGMIGGKDKVDMAKEALYTFLSRNKGVFKNITVKVYGGGDCRKTPNPISLSPGGELKELNLLKNLSPGGKANMTYALESSLKDLKGEKGNILLISSGADDCEYESCKKAKEIIGSGAKVSVYAIGLGIFTEREMERLKCIASSTGGKYFNATDPATLKDAFKKIEAKVGYNLEIKVFKGKDEEVTEYMRSQYTYNWGCDVYESGTDKKVTSTNTFPARFFLSEGVYDVKVHYGSAEKWLRGLTVNEGKRTTTSVSFAKGSVVVKVFKGDSQVIGVKRVPTVQWWCEVYETGGKEKKETTETFPIELDLFAGKYDIKVHFMGEEKWLRGILVQEGKTVRSEVRFH